MKRRYKNYINYVLDFSLLLSIAFTLTSSYILWFVLPQGLGYHGYYKCNLQGYGVSGTYYEALGWNRVTWIDVHNWASVALLAIVLLHIILHWGWIVATTKRVKGYISRRVRRVMELYIAAIVLFILFLFESLSGFVLWLILPRGAGDFNFMKAGVGRTFWGLQRNVWTDLHAWVAVAILSIIIIDMVLNWNWFFDMSKKLLRSMPGVLSKPFRRAG